MSTYAIRVEILHTSADEATDEDFYESAVEYSILEQEVLVVDTIAEASDIFEKITS